MVRLRLYETLMLLPPQSFEGISVRILKANCFILELQVPIRIY